MAMNEITKIKVNKMMDRFVERLSYLYSRWQDEKKYEDFQEYSDAMHLNFTEYCKELIMQNAVYIKCQKRPFGIVFDFEGWRVTMSITNKEIKCYATKLK